MSQLNQNAVFWTEYRQAIIAHFQDEVRSLMLNRLSDGTSGTAMFEDPQRFGAVENQLTEKFRCKVVRLNPIGGGA